MSAADTCKQRGIPVVGMPLLLFRPGGYQKIGIHFPSSPEEGCPTGGVVGKKYDLIYKWIILRYHLPLRVLLLPGGGEWRYYLTFGTPSTGQEWHTDDSDATDDH